MQSQIKYKEKFIGKTKSHRTVFIAVMVALAMIFSYIESLFQVPIPVPGIKLGIANIVILIAIYRINYKSALLINVIRIFLVGFLFTGTFGIMYSLSGGLLSFSVMALLKRTVLFSVIGVSMAGGVFHNIGQLIIAGFLVNNMNIFLYLPVLLVSGIVTGIVLGILATVIMDRLNV